MLIDTDVLIEFQQGNPAALKSLEKIEDRFISMQSAMEFLQGARNPQEIKLLKKFLFDYDFTVLPLTENIGHRALIYIEEYALAHGIRAGDAIVAATAVENGQSLLTGNARHFRAIKDLDLVTFR
ncbi:MAG: type II toxin-antitoxin system VapC family toxin [Elusimicrobia bacterium]|nr:type II toxin-antitoxin system VapC family toxin [Elusimicrobiota bacterium]